eukprot:GHVP01026350.1.p1 GENE.GHVP01026350.1~~GHVP01026350.1.p1  ORF type:complete len:138 (+),score=20.61 GHVP01026350.1:3-416(+)
MFLNPEDNVCWVFPEEEELNLTDNETGKLLECKSHFLNDEPIATTEDRYSFIIDGLESEVIHFFDGNSSINFLFSRGLENSNVFYKIKARKPDLDKLKEIKQSSQSDPPHDAVLPHRDPLYDALTVSCTIPDQLFQN